MTLEVLFTVSQLSWKVSKLVIEPMKNLKFFFKFEIFDPKFLLVIIGDMD